MPIFEFKCKKCGEVFESFIMKGAENINCPKCNSSEVEKLISAPNISGSSDSAHGHSCGGHTGGFS